MTSPEKIQTLTDLLSPDLIQQAFSLTDTLTLRKRKLPLESMGWLVIGMALYNNRPLSQIVNLMGIVDRTGHPFTAPSSVIQRRKTLAEDPMKALFKLTADYWHQEARQSGAVSNGKNGIPSERGLSAVSVELQRDNK